MRKYDHTSTLILTPSQTLMPIKERLHLNPERYQPKKVKKPDYPDYSLKVLISSVAGASVFDV